MRTRAIARWSAVLAVAFIAACFAPAAGAVPGELVTTFGPDGNGTISRGANAAVLVQPDGQVVTVGSFAAVVPVTRQSTTGRLDRTFGTGGIAHVAIPGDGWARGAALQTDGKIVVVGDAHRSTNDDFFVARLDANGRLDGTFGTGGIVTTDLGGADRADDVAIAPDGKIVAVGTARGDEVGIARYTTRGALDTTFSGDGRDVSNFPAAAGATRVLVLANRKIVVGGGSMLLERFNENGSLDHGFGVDGRADPASTSLADVRAMVAQGTDILVGGTTASGDAAAVARFHTNGHIDATFGTDGTALVPIAGMTVIEDLALDASDRIVGFGEAILSPDFVDTRGFTALFRFTPSGHLDTTFGCRGTVVNEALGPEIRSSRATAGAVAGKSLLVGVFAQRVSTSTQAPLVAMLMRFANAAPAGGAGLTLLRGDGGTSAFGNSPPCAPVIGVSVAPLVGIAHDPVARGAWTVASDGGVFRTGAARFFGSAANARLASPIVGIAAAPDGRGYWLAAADGGVFAFGSARFFGSMGAVRLHSPVVGIAAAPDGRGYWLVAADGGVFAFGSARFSGSMGAVRLHSPVVGIAPAGDGRGYLVAAADGGVFAFGSARFEGSMGAVRLVSPVVGIAADPDGRGYWLAAADGGVFAFGAEFVGSTAAARLTSGPQATVGLAAP
jgi:uncharacterized delta-60 repeat protein